MTPEDATLLWLRRDLRLADNPALLAALRRPGGLLPVAFWPEEERAWAPGAASRWWLWQSLIALESRLERLGSRLLVLQGRPEAVLPNVAGEAGARAVTWAAGLDPSERDDDRDVAAALAAAGLQSVVAPAAALLHDPARLLTGEGRPYTVFTPFWRALLARVRVEEPVPAPAALPPAPALPTGVPLAALEAEAVRPWAARFAQEWTPGEDGAHQALERFLDEGLEVYVAQRDRPDFEGTSRLSPHLHHGELTARQVWSAVSGRLAESGLEPEAALAPPAWDGPQAPGLGQSAGAFLRQLGWREFAHHLLRHFPATPEQPLRPQFARMPWRHDPEALEAWRRGRTGVPLVDAGMRQLWATGWVHNRVRLVVASLLTKHLLLPWQAGAAWFWDTLLDADLADNTLGWQWVAGCGADAAPYFRILNPVTQGRRHDPEGTYVRVWVPALTRLPAEHIHAPWLAPPDVLAEAGVTLGEDYPLPLVDLGEGRARALAAYEAVKRGDTAP